MGYKSKLLYELDYLEYVLETGMWDDEATILTDKEIEDLKRRIEDLKEDIETEDYLERHGECALNGVNERDFY